MTFSFLTLKRLLNYRKPYHRQKSILKILAMFFGLTGILQPIVINLKILFQKLDWDEVISEELQKERKIRFRLN